MKRYKVTAYWTNGFVFDYDVTGGVPGSKSDPIMSARNHMDRTRNIVRYTIAEEDGTIVYERNKDDKD